MDKEPITSEGLEKLKKELEELKSIKRPKIVAAIAEARGHGDLKENAEYHAAKEEQAKIESRVIEINDLIARANVIDITSLEKKGDVVGGPGLPFPNQSDSERICYYSKRSFLLLDILILGNLKQKKDIVIGWNLVI